MARDSSLARPPAQARSTLSASLPPLVPGEHGYCSIALPVDRDAPAAARKQVVRALYANAVGAAVAADVAVLVEELVSNVVAHENAPLVTIELAVEVDGVVTVLVSGAGGEASVALTHPDPAGPSGPGGRGARVLDSLASSWGTRRRGGRTGAWFTVGDVAAGEVTRPQPSPDDETSIEQTRSADEAPFGRRPASSPHAASAEVVAEAIAIAAAIEAELTAEPAVVAVRAAVTAEQAAAHAAAMTADAAHRARAARALAATLAAHAVAEAAARTVASVQSHADELAVAVAIAAAQAAATLSNSIVAGGDAEAARAAVRVGATVMSTAAAKAEDTARAAVLVAREVAAAASAVAATTAAASAAMENEVRDAALAIQAVTTATAKQLATDTLERGAALTLAHREAAAISERLHETNRRLRRASRHDRAVALALQEAMLTRLPDPIDLQLAARYVTAAEQDEVGGDWYDALVLPNGSTILVIGDVVGHDIAAAAVMGQLRNILRALIWDRDEPPSALLTRLDRAIRDLHIDTMATVLLLSVEQPPADQHAGPRMLQWANAGHPAPMLVHSDGTAITLEDSTDVLLGVRPDSPRRDHTHVVAPGSTLLLYTDGLIEARDQDTDIGQDRLLAALRTHHRLEPGKLLDAVLSDMVGHAHTDDIAALAVRFPEMNPLSG